MVLICTRIELFYYYCTVFFIFFLSHLGRSHGDPISARGPLFGIGAFIGKMALERGRLRKRRLLRGRSAESIHFGIFLMSLFSEAYKNASTDVVIIGRPRKCN